MSLERAKEAELITGLKSTVEPLLCCQFPGLNRGVGVSVNWYTDSHAGIEGGKAVDLSYEVPSMNTSTYGSWKHIGNVKSEYISMHKTIIAELEKQIAELVSHRDRLSRAINNFTEH